MGKGGAEQVEETADQKTAARVGVEQWNEYAKVWAPKIQTWAQDIAGDKTAEKSRAAGIVNADVAQKTGGAEKALTMTGMDPNSGRAVKALATATDKGGEVEAGATVSAKQGVDSNQLAGLQQVANVGMGQKTEAIDGMSDIAETSVQNAIVDAGMDQLSHQADVRLGMSAAGVAAGAGMDYFANKPEVAGSMTDYDTGTRDYIKQNAGDDYRINGNNIDWK